MIVTEEDILAALDENEETFEDLIATIVNHRTGFAGFTGFTFRLGMSLIEGTTTTLLALIGKEKIICCEDRYRRIH